MISGFISICRKHSIPRGISTNLASGLVETQVMPELLLTHSTRCVDLVTENKERNLGEFLDRKKSIQFRLGFGETFKVGRVDKEDDTVDLGEVVTPETTSCRKTNSKVRKGGSVTNRE